MDLYESFHWRYPQPALLDNSGKPLLSWRVQILRELDQSDLYDEFRLDEPWDSEHNKKLIDRMPEVFGSASGEDKGKTRFMLFVGPGSAFEGEEAVLENSITDGTSNTILIVEAGPDRAVPWTKPEDLTFDPENPIAALGKGADKGFGVVFFDGFVEHIDKSVSPERLRLWIDPSDGEPLDDLETWGEERASQVPIPEKAASEGSRH
jgi:hypothetical protein